MENQALHGSETTELHQDYYEALKNVQDIIEQQNVKLQKQTREMNEKKTKQHNDGDSDRTRLLVEKKKLEAILKLLKNEDKAKETEDEGIDEIREARDLLIDSLREVENNNPIGVKKMGYLESTPFYYAIKSHNKKEDALRLALNKCALWNKKIRDRRWNPFKVVEVDGESLEIVNDDDKKLKALKMEMGEKVYGAVTKALSEMNEYNPKRRETALELWNYSEGRRATLKEGIASILTQMEQRKRTRLLP